MARRSQDAKTELRDEYRTLESLTSERLRLAIIQGELVPGERLKERDLSTAWGVSTTPVKEALRRLETEGLVVREPARGAVVAENIKSLLSEMGLLRAALEGVAAYLAAAKADDSDIADLSVQVEEMERLTQSGDVNQVLTANEAFHELIHDVAANRSLNQMLRIVRSYDRATRLKVLSNRSDMERGLKEHIEIFEAISAGNPELAEQKTRSHVLNNLPAGAGFRENR